MYLCPIIPFSGATRFKACSFGHVLRNAVLEFSASDNAASWGIRVNTDLYRKSRSRKPTTTGGVDVLATCLEDLSPLSAYKWKWDQCSVGGPRSSMGHITKEKYRNMGFQQALTLKTYGIFVCAMLLGRNTHASSKYCVITGNGWWND